MIETHTATVIAETEDAVVVRTAAGVTYPLHYYEIPATYGVGDVVELTVETAPAPSYSKTVAGQGATKTVAAYVAA